jgi:hypothetical protein
MYSLNLTQQFGFLCSIFFEEVEYVKKNPLITIEVVNIYKHLSGIHTSTWQ